MAVVILQSVTECSVPGRTPSSIFPPHGAPSGLHSGSCPVGLTARALARIGLTDVAAGPPFLLGSHPAMAGPPSSQISGLPAAPMGVRVCQHLARARHGRSVQRSQRRARGQGDLSHWLARSSSCRSPAGSISGAPERGLLFDEVVDLLSRTPVAGLAARGVLRWRWNAERRPTGGDPLGRSAAGPPRPRGLAMRDLNQPCPPGRA
jgi:hypothetical protein